MVNTKTPVLIVGAGPTGLILAVWLRKKGIAVRIIDKSDGPGKTSRAIAVQARTLEFYRQLGLADKLIDLGITVKNVTMWRSGKPVAVARIGKIGEGKSPFPYLLFCAQDVHEDLLIQTLKDMGTHVERKTELIEFSQDESGVSATLESPQGRETVSADFLCGCDGAHSSVRHGLKEGFPGGTYSQVFFVADVIASGKAGEEGVQLSLSSKDFCIIMPIKSRNTIRLTGLVPPESENKEKIKYSDVADSVAKNTGLNVTEVIWFSSYHVHHRVADGFHQGRVFLAGDAGHIHSPAGGQGMNTGIGDAINLAWKLAEVLQGKFSTQLLNSYEPERIAFARVLVKTTDTAFKFIANRSLMGSVFRAYILPTLFAFLVRFKVFLHFAFRTISQIRITYRKSFLSQGSAGKVVAGDRLPWVEDNYQFLKSLDWQIHIYGKANSQFSREVKALQIPVHEITWNKEFLRDAVYLIRPDGYVGLALETQNVEIIKGYLKKIGRY